MRKAKIQLLMGIGLIIVFFTYTQASQQTSKKVIGKGWIISINNSTATIYNQENKPIAILSSDSAGKVILKVLPIKK